MIGLRQDLAFGFRVLRIHPGFTAAAVLSLALGIGANTAVYSLVNTLLLLPFPVRDPERLVAIHTSREGIKYGRSSYPDYRDVLNRCNAFSGVLARFYWPVSVRRGGAPKVVLANLVSANYFEVLGVKPLTGRTFLPEEGAEGTTNAVVVLSHYLWKRSLGADPGVLGSTLQINGQQFTVVGIGPEAFRGEMVGFATDLWIPIPMASRILPVRPDLQDRGSGWIDMMGLLEPGVHEKQAQSALETLASNLRQEYATSDRGKTFAVVSGATARFPVVELGRGIIGFLSVLSGIVGLTLLIACSNVANLLLARGAGRKREIAMRLALGAGRRRVIRQLLTESLLLSVLSGLAGLLVAMWAIDLFSLVDAPTPIPVALDVRLDYRVLAFTFLLSLLTGVIFGLTPALHASRLDVRTALNEQSSPATGGPSKSRLQAYLVTGQIALSLVLFIAAGLCLKSLRAAISAYPGFEIRNGLAVGLNLSYAGYDESRGRAFYRSLIERVEQLPGVRSASLALVVPLSYMSNTERVSREGYEPRSGESLLVQNNAVGARYFETLGIPILRGRGIDQQDRQDTEPVAVINETMARRFWRGTDAVDKSFAVDGMKVRVVGVVGDGKYFHLGEKQESFFYRPLSQVYSAFTTLHVKTAGDPRLLIKPVREILEKLDSSLPVSEMRTLEEHMRLSQYPARIAGLTVSCFGTLALALAVVGVYGVMSYSVRQRTREFGIRIALGASPGEIQRLVLRRGLRILLLGLLAGLALAFATTRLLSSLLFGVSAVDPVIFIGVSLVLAIVVGLACFFPARWASKCDPAESFRCE
jgi:predicted permease